MSVTFESLGLPEALLQAVADQGYTQPTTIQEQTIPVLLGGADLMAQGHTGTGKTAAFSLPLLAQLNTAETHVQGLVLAPTRELATQVARSATDYGRHLGARVVAIYGGQSYGLQLRRLAQGAHVVVGTPGRLLDLIRKGSLQLDRVRHLVLDEADEMLRLGFIEDVEAILAATPGSRQTALFSATLPDAIRRLAKGYMRDPVQISVVGGQLTVDRVVQRYHVVDARSKVGALVRLLEVEEVDRALVFCRTRNGAGTLAETLVARGFAAEALHGDLSQEVREVVLRRFRSGSTRLLVATDVAARGLDISGVSHVFNLDFPDAPEDYVHRIGRTARAGTHGIAISLVTVREQKRVTEVALHTGRTLVRGVLPTVAEVHAARDARFASNLQSALEGDCAAGARAWVGAQLAAGTDALELAVSAVAALRAQAAQRPDDDVVEVFAKKGAKPGSTQGGRDHEPGMVRLRIDRGRAQGVKVGEVVASLARETNLPGSVFGAIDIMKNQTLVDVPEKVVDKMLHRLRKGFYLRGPGAQVTPVESMTSHGEDPVPHAPSTKPSPSERLDRPVTRPHPKATFRSKPPAVTEEQNAGWDDTPRQTPRARKGGSPTSDFAAPSPRPKSSRKGHAPGRPDFNATGARRSGYRVFEETTGQEPGAERYSRAPRKASDRPQGRASERFEGKPFERPLGKGPGRKRTEGSSAPRKGREQRLADPTSSPRGTRSARNTQGGAESPRSQVRPGSQGAQPDSKKAKYGKRVKKH